MMQRLLGSFTAALVLASTGISVAQQNKVPEEVWRRAQIDSVVRIIVYLDCCRQIIEGTPSQQAQLERARQQALAETQDKLLASLAGTHYRVTARARVVGVPFVGLEVGADALAMVERSPVVFTVKNKVPGEVWQKAQTNGAVRIIVQLDVATTPMSVWHQRPDLARTDQQAIAEAQDKLVDSLLGTKYKVTGRLRITPGMGLDVGVDALAVMERSPLVIWVTEDKPARPAQ